MKPHTNMTTEEKSEKAFPTISVVMPTFNGEKYIEEAINSILRQTFTDFELIIVNDGSTDDTEKIVFSYKSEKIRYYSNDKNLGICASYNKLIDLSRGEFIAIAEHDDISHPQRLERQLCYMRRNPQVGVVSSRLKLFRGNTPPANACKVHKSIVESRSPERIRRKLFTGTMVAHSVVMFRKSIFVDLGIRYDENLTYSFDVDLFLRISLVTDVIELKDQLLLYRLHENNTSKNIKMNSICTKKLFTNFIKNNFGVDFSDVFDDYYRVNDVENFILLDSGMEKILKMTEDDPKYHTKELRKHSVRFLYKQLRNTHARTNDYKAIYHAYRKSRLLRYLSINRKLWFHLQALRAKWTSRA